MERATKVNCVPLLHFCYFLANKMISIWWEVNLPLVGFWWFFKNIKPFHWSCTDTSDLIGWFVVDGRTWLALVDTWTSLPADNSPTLRSASVTVCGSWICEIRTHIKMKKIVVLVVFDASTYSVVRLHRSHFNNNFLHLSDILFIFTNQFGWVKYAMNPNEFMDQTRHLDGFGRSS